MDCIFCNIARGTAPAHSLWEDQSHMAFLSIFPTPQGSAWSFPRLITAAYGFAQSDEVLCELVVAAKKDRMAD